MPDYVVRINKTVKGYITADTHTQAKSQASEILGADKESLRVNHYYSDEVSARDRGLARRVNLNLRAQ